jgi:hypothetical protein
MLRLCTKRRTHGEYEVGTGGGIPPGLGLSAIRSILKTSSVGSTGARCEPQRVVLEVGDCPFTIFYIGGQPVTTIAYLKLQMAFMSPAI